MRGVLRCLLPLLACVCLSSCHKSSDAASIVEALAKVPCVYSSNPEKDFEAIEGRLDLLERDDSPTGDQALVMLMGYHLGEHNHEQLMIEIVRRGKRMKPLLLREMEKPASISTCAPSLEKQVVREHAESLISAIDKGERWD